MTLVKCSAVMLLVVASVACSSTTGVSPTATVPSSTSSATGIVTVASVNLQPLVARLGDAEGFLESANNALTACQTQLWPPDPCFNKVDSAVDFYSKGNGVLDVLVSSPNWPPDPCMPEIVTVVSLIRGQVSITNNLLVNIPGNPVTAALIAAITPQVAHISSLLSGPLSCHFS
jgi:hypothetical protein